MDPVLLGLEGQGFESGSICCHWYGCQFCIYEGVWEREEKAQYQPRNVFPKTIPTSERLLSHQLLVVDSLLRILPIIPASAYFSIYHFFLDLSPF